MEPTAARRSVRLDGFDYTSADSYFITICTQHKEHRFGHISDGVMHLNEAGRMISERILAIPAKFPGTLVDSYVVMPNHIHFILTLLGYQPNGGPASNGGLTPADGLVSDGGYVGAAHRGRPLSDRQGRPGTLPPENDGKTTHIPDDSDWLGYGVSGPIGPKAGSHDGPPLQINDPAIDHADYVNDPIIDHVANVDDPAIHQSDDINELPVNHAANVDDPAIDNVPTKTRNVPRVADVVGWFKANTTNYYINGVKSGRYPAFDRRLWQRNYYEHIIRTDAAYNQIDEYVQTNPVRWGEDRLR